MIERYRDGSIPAGEERSLDGKSREAVARYTEVMDESLLHLGIAAVLELASHANGFVEEQAPWSLAKDPDAAAELDATLHSLARALAVLATLLFPIMPGKMSELASRLGLDEVPTVEGSLTVELAGRTVRRGDPLFPRPDLDS